MLTTPESSPSCCSTQCTVTSQYIMKSNKLTNFSHRSALPLSLIQLRDSGSNTVRDSRSQPRRRDNTRPQLLPRRTRAWVLTQHKVYLFLPTLSKFLPLSSSFSFPQLAQLDRPTSLPSHLEHRNQQPSPIASRDDDEVCKTNTLEFALNSVLLGSLDRGGGGHGALSLTAPASPRRLSSSA